VVDVRGGGALHGDGLRQQARHPHQVVRGGDQARIRLQIVSARRGVWAWRSPRVIRASAAALATGGALRRRVQRQRAAELRRPVTGNLADDQGRPHLRPHVRLDGDVPGVAVLLELRAAPPLRDRALLVKAQGGGHTPRSLRLIDSRAGPWRSPFSG
jgi:hypothetical protein